MQRKNEENRRTSSKAGFEIQIGHLGEENQYPNNGVEGDYWYIRNKKVLLTPYINGTRAKKVLVVQGGAATEIK